jgi:ubiquinone/menaquinone biosynthesis C-methylase UbiE
MKQEMNSNIDVFSTLTLNETITSVLPKPNVHLGLSQAKLEKISKAYSSSPIWYDIRGFFILKLAYRSTLWNQISFFSKNMGENHLEAAVGSGTLFDMILKFRALTFQKRINIVAFDYAEKMLAGAFRRFGNNRNVRLALADVGNMPYASHSFETVNVANSIHSFPEIEPAFAEIFRVLKVNGTFAGNVLTYPKGNGVMARIARAINTWGIKKGILHRPYEAAEIRTLLLKNGFVITFEEQIRNCYNFIAQK